MCKSILDKYRPSRLCEIVGQDEITSALAKDGCESSIASQNRL
jgi:DNA polymerase III gamma/tau subunit